LPGHGLEVAPHRRRAPRNIQRKVETEQTCQFRTVFLGSGAFGPPNGHLRRERPSKIVEETRSRQDTPDLRARRSAIVGMSRSSVDSPPTGSRVTASEPVNREAASRISDRRPSSCPPRSGGEEASQRVEESRLRHEDLFERLKWSPTTPRRSRPTRRGQILGPDTAADCDGRHRSETPCPDWLRTESRAFTA